MADPTGDLARLRRLEVRPAEVFGSAQDAFRGHLATVFFGSLCTSPPARRHGDWILSEPAALARRPPAIDRSFDRLVALAAIGIAVAYLLASTLAVLLPAEVRRGAWLPLHLALAGGATTAIAGVMPYFTCAFAAAPPSDRWLRLAAVGAVALGALGVAFGVASDLVLR
jgi:hypothetical protein